MKYASVPFGWCSITTVGSSQWAVIESIAKKIGCTLGTVRNLLWRSEREHAQHPGLTCDESGSIKTLECEHQKLCQVNDILREVRRILSRPSLDAGWIPHGNRRQQPIHGIAKIYRLRVGKFGVHQYTLLATA